MTTLMPTIADLSAHIGVLSQSDIWIDGSGQIVRIVEQGPAWQRDLLHWLRSHKPRLEARLAHAGLPQTIETTPLYVTLQRLTTAEPTFEALRNALREQSLLLGEVVALSQDRLADECEVERRAREIARELRRIADQIHGPEA